MRFRAFILGLFCCVALSAQTAMKWQQIYGGSGIEAGYAVKSCLDQGYIVAGVSSIMGPSDGYIVRTDSVGLVMWSKLYGGNNVDVIRSIETLSDSGFITAGYTNSMGNGGYDGWIMRLDKNGDTLWTFTLGTTDWDFFYDVAVTPDSGFVFVGGTYGAGQGDEDFLFLKLDSTGTLQWLRTYGGTQQDEGRSLCIMPDSSIAACGFSYSLGDSLGDSWIMKLNPVNGDTVWATTAHFPNQEDKAYGICCSFPFNFLYFCGYRQTSPGNDDPYFNYWLFNGDSLLSATFGGADDEYYYSVVARPEGTAACVGTNYSAGFGLGDMMMFTTQPVWNSTTYGTYSLDQGYGIDVTHDGGYIMCGLTEGYNSYQANVYLVKTDSLGYYNPVLGIREAPKNYSFGSVQPNPATSLTTITYDSPELQSDHLVLEVVDVTGRIVENNNTEWHRLSGTSVQFMLDVAGFENGVYFYRISDGSDAVTTGSFAVSH